MALLAVLAGVLAAGVVAAGVAPGPGLGPEQPPPPVTVEVAAGDDEVRLAPGAAQGGRVEPPGTTASPGPPAPAPVREQERWRLTTAAEITVLDSRSGTVVLGTDDGGLHRIDGASGAVVWSLGLSAAPSALHLDGISVLVGTTTGGVLALDVHDGAVRWSGPVAPDRAIRSITGSGEGLLVTAGPAAHTTLQAVDRRDGRVRWQQTLGPGAITVDGAVVQLTGTALQGFDATRSSPRWRLEVGAGERLVGHTGRHVVTRDAAASRFRDPATGRVVASAEPEVAWWGAAPDPVVLVRHAAGGQVLLEATTRGQLTRTDLPLPPVAGNRLAGIAGGTAVLLPSAGPADWAEGAGSEPELLARGGFAGVDLRSGELRWQFPEADRHVGYDPLVVAGARVVIAPPTEVPDAASTRHPGLGSRPGEQAGRIAPR